MKNEKEESKEEDDSKDWTKNFMNRRDMSNDGPRDSFHGAL